MPNPSPVYPHQIYLSVIFLMGHRSIGLSLAGRRIRRASTAFRATLTWCPVRDPQRPKSLVHANNSWHFTSGNVNLDANAQAVW